MNTSTNNKRMLGIPTFNVCCNKCFTNYRHTSEIQQKVVNRSDLKDSIFVTGDVKESEKFSRGFLHFMFLFYTLKTSISASHLSLRPKTADDFGNQERVLRLLWLIRQRRFDTRYLLRNGVLEDRRILGEIFIFRKAKKAFKWITYWSMAWSKNLLVRKKVSKVNLYKDARDVIQGVNFGFPYGMYNNQSNIHFLKPDESKSQSDVIHFLSSFRLELFGVSKGKVGVLNHRMKQNKKTLMMKRGFWFWKLELNIREVLNWVSCGSNPETLKAEYCFYIPRSRSVQMYGVLLGQIMKEYIGLCSEAFGDDMLAPDLSEQFIRMSRIPDLSPKENFNKLVRDEIRKSNFNSTVHYQWARHYLQIYKIHPLLALSYNPFVKILFLKVSERVLESSKEKIGEEEKAHLSRPLKVGFKRVKVACKKKVQKTINSQYFFKKAIQKIRKKGTVHSMNMRNINSTIVARLNLFKHKFRFSDLINIQQKDSRK